MARRTVIATRTISDSASGTGELVPEGVYNAIISDVSEQAVKSGDNQGQPMYKVECKITDDEQKGRKATKWVMLFPGKEGKAMISYYQLLASIGEGIEFDDGKEEQEVEILDPPELINQELRIKIVHEVYEPTDGTEKRMTYKLNRFMPANDSTPKSAGGSKAGPAKAAARGKQRVKI